MTFSVYSVLVAVLDGSTSLWRYAFLALFGIVVLVRLFLEFELSHAAFSDDPSSREVKTNCPSCGARTTIDLDGCEYCGEPIDG